MSIKQLVIGALLFSGLALNVQAGPWHYIKTHKELLASDGIVIGAIFADAGSSVYCQRNNPIGCYETNGLLGAHPNAGPTLALGSGIAGGMVLGNHLIWHFAPEKSDRHIIWFLTIPIAIEEGFTVKNNINVAH